MEITQLDRIEHKLDLQMGYIVYKELYNNLFESLAQDLESDADIEEERLDEKRGLLKMYSEEIEAVISRYVTLFYSQSTKLSEKLDVLLENEEEE